MSPPVDLPRRRPRRPPPGRLAGGRTPVPLGAPRASRLQALSILGNELRGLVRDRRALLMGVLLPVVLYPLIFLGQAWLDGVAQGSLESKEVEVVLALEGLPEEFAAALREGLIEAGPTRLAERPAGDLGALFAARGAPGEVASPEERAAARALLGEQGAALLARAPAERTQLLLYVDRADDRANAARDRIRKVLGELETLGRARLLDELLGGDPGAAVRLEVVDVASAQDRGGLALGKLLPFLAVLVVLSGASFAALASFSGEREAGTLEALLVQPVTARAIACGKLTAVATVGAATLVLNVASILLCLALGLGELPGAEGLAAGAGLIGLPRLVLASALLLPAVVLLSAALSLVAARASTFREGQHYILPLVLVALLPVALGAQGDLELDALLALVPLTGATLAMRDALAGDLVPWLGALAFVAHAGWAALLAARVATRLDAERLLAGRDLAEEAARRRLASQAALRLGWTAVIGLYLVGGYLQVQSPVWGLAASLWGLLLPLALVGAWFVKGHTGGTWSSTLGLRRPRALHLLGALLVAPGLARLMGAYLGWQMEVLPLPRHAGEGLFPRELLELGPLAAVALLALTPAVTEELFFRGSVLSGLRRDLGPRATVAWQALLFGLAHASIHRLLPTAFLGALLALVMLRARSIWVAMLLHGAYNAWLVTAAKNPWSDSRALVWLAPLGAFLLLLPGHDGDGEERDGRAGRRLG